MHACMHALVRMAHTAAAHAGRRFGIGFKQSLVSGSECSAGWIPAVDQRVHACSSQSTHVQASEWRVRQCRAYGVLRRERKTGCPDAVQPPLCCHARRYRLHRLPGSQLPHNLSTERVSAAGHSGHRGTGNAQREQRLITLSVILQAGQLYARGCACGGGSLIPAGPHPNVYIRQH